MDNEFKTHVEEDVIKAILEKGHLQESEVSSRCLTAGPGATPHQCPSEITSL